MTDDDKISKDIEALAFLVLIGADYRSIVEENKAFADKVKFYNRLKKHVREELELAAVAASTIASALRPGAILAAPNYSLKAARELTRWIEFIAKRRGDEFKRLNDE